MKRVVVVDTNVPLVANGEYPAGVECIARCAQALADVYEGRVRLAIDDDYRIIGEYRNKLSTNGPRLAGTEFFKWVVTYHANPERVDRVPLTPKARDDRDFDEFPKHPGLATFDSADRKFVAVSHAHPARPPILQAVDRKWWSEWYPALQEVGVEVRFLCPEEIGMTISSPGMKRRRGKRRKKKRG